MIVRLPPVGCVSFVFFLVRTSDIHMMDVTLRDETAPVLLASNQGHVAFVLETFKMFSTKRDRRTQVEEFKMVFSKPHVAVHTLLLIMNDAAHPVRFKLLYQKSSRTQPCCRRHRFEGRGG